MTATFLALSVAHILIGCACLIFPQQIGTGFCRLAKWTWKKATLGLTDMGWAYGEEGTPSLFRLLGGGFLFSGLVFITFVFLSFFGPGSLYAMREASNYLRQTYGDASGAQSVSAKKQTDDATIVKITYRYGDRTGELTGEWRGGHYVFREVE